MNIAVVTGASSGMGKEFVLQLSEYVKVDEIWVIARSENKLEELQCENHFLQLLFHIHQYRMLQYLFLCLNRKGLPNRCR